MVKNTVIRENIAVFFLTLSLRTSHIGGDHTTTPGSGIQMMHIQVLSVVNNVFFIGRTFSVDFIDILD